MTNAMEVVNVSKRIGKSLILEGVNFSVPEGVAFGIIGPNGAGKTTLLRILIGFYRPTEGNVIVQGEGVSGSEYKRQVGFSAQDNGVYDDLTVEENVSYFASIYGVPKKSAKERAEELLRIVELENSRKMLVKNLSGGMKKRLDIVCSLINDPKILILDEPFSGLDPHQRKEILELLGKVKSSGTTIIISSHLLSDLEWFCERVCLVVSGKVIFVGEPYGLKKEYLNRIRLTIKTNPESHNILIDELSRFPLEMDRANRIYLTVSYEELNYVMAKIMEIMREYGGYLTYLDVREPSLDELFESFVG